MLTVAQLPRHIESYGSGKCMMDIKDAVFDNIWWCPDYQEVHDMAFMKIDRRDL